MLKFEHQFVEEPRYGQISDELFETPPEAKIQFSIREDGIWLWANSQGFLHLARVFAEFGMRDFEEGFHIHYPEWFEKSAGSKQEMTVAIDNGDWSSDAQS
jgi:hypothetical protein